MAPFEAWQPRLAAGLPAGPWRTRFAPAPTGFLHLGHLVNALFVWGIARAHGGLVLLRVEDHDASRCRPEYERALLDDLEWLGLEPDAFPVASFRQDPVTHPTRQSNQSARYDAALDALHAAGLVYACQCSRRDIAALIPHAAGEEPRYPGSCRARHIAAQATPARRVILEPITQRFEELRHGMLVQDPSQQCGDLLVRDRQGQWTYQFAVVVDDLAHDIDVVIRGDDLLQSTGRQRQLAGLLNGAPPKVYLHHPLIVHPDGRKLSKSSGDTALRELRAAGQSVPMLLGRAAHLAGLLPDDRPVPFEAIVERFAAR